MNKIKVMEPILSKTVIDNKFYIHQIKWDGIRGIIVVDNNMVKIFTKRGNERTNTYPELHNIVSQFKGSQCILDGEIVVLNENLVPSFNQVLIRDKQKKDFSIKEAMHKHPVSYIIFDILYYNNKDLRNYSWVKRDGFLRSKIVKSEIITLADSFEDGNNLLKLAMSNNLEGIVSKDINSKYVSGKTHNKWHKTKITKKMLAVICGIKLKDNYPSSLILGIYNEGNLNYIGSVSSGLKQSDLVLLNNNLNNLIHDKTIFPEINTKEILWIKPILTCWVNYLEWNNDGSLRHPKVIGFSNENPKNAVGKEYTYNDS